MSKSGRVKWPLEIPCPKSFPVRPEHKSKAFGRFLLSVCWNEVKTKWRRFSDLRDAFRMVQHGLKRNGTTFFPCVYSVLVPVASLLRKVEQCLYALQGLTKSPELLPTKFNWVDSGIRPITNELLPRVNNTKCVSF